MSFENEIKKISDRVDKFLEINKEVSAFDLKFHIQCKTSDLLLALGMLAERDKVELTRKKNGVHISAKNSK